MAPRIITTSSTTSLFSLPFRLILHPISSHSVARSLSTLPQNPHIYIHPSPTPTPSLTNSTTYTLSYLPTVPPKPHLAIGTTPTNPPTPDNLTVNPQFLRLLHAVIRKHAHSDPSLVASAAAFASTSGSTLGGGGLFPSNHPASNMLQGRAGRGRGVTARVRYGSETGAGGASAQGGYGSGGHTGFMHVADERCPAAYGRIPEPEDIFGSLEVDAQGGFVDGDGRYAESGTYRVITRDGILGLSPFLREKLLERLRVEDEKGG